MALTQKQAIALFNRLGTVTLKADELAMEIIREKAWRSAGHETLCAAWETYYADVEFTGLVNVKIVFAMYDDGSSPREIAAAIKGITPRTVRNWVAEREQGELADDEIARKRKGATKGKPSTIFLHFGSDRLSDFEKYTSELRGCTATEFAFDASKREFALLAKEYEEYILGQDDDDISATG